MADESIPAEKTWKDSIMLPNSSYIHSGALQQRKASMVPTEGLKRWGTGVKNNTSTGFKSMQTFTAYKVRSNLNND